MKKTPRTEKEEEEEVQSNKNVSKTFENNHRARHLAAARHRLAVLSPTKDSRRGSNLPNETTTILKKQLNWFVHSKVVLAYFDNLIKCHRESTLVLVCCCYGYLIQWTTFRRKMAKVSWEKITSNELTMVSIGTNWYFTKNRSASGLTWVMNLT